MAHPVTAHPVDRGDRGRELRSKNTWGQGLYLLRGHRLIGIRIPIINLKRSSDRLRFIMGILIHVRRRLFGEYKSSNKTTITKKVSFGFVITNQ